LRRKPVRFAIIVSLVPALAVISLAGCSIPLDRLESLMKSGTVRASTLKRMESLNMDRAAAVLIRIYKEESALEVWKQDRTGRFALLTIYPICRFSGKLGPKVSEGDRQAPEGFYDVTPEQMNPLSHEYLAFNIGFPNAFDRALGRTGSFLMVHGGCKSIGCYAMTDGAMGEIYALLDEAFKGGQDKVQLQALPFRMTRRNLIEYARNPNIGFWKMLRAGSDLFEATRRPPDVSVCDHRYVFRVEAADGGHDIPAFCPSDKIPLPVARGTALHQPTAGPAERSQRDDPIARMIEEDSRSSH
jgi:murein L,D-transpeptidase YafK